METQPPVTHWVTAAMEQYGLAVFGGLLLLLAVMELLHPGFKQPAQRRSRWPANLLLGLSVLILGMVLPVTTVLAAYWASNEGYGLFNMVTGQGWISFFATLLIRSFVSYAFHVTAHKIPVLWRIHRVHHSDTHLDATTGLRSHPLELLLLVPVAVAVTIAFGLSPLALLLYELAESLNSLLSHSNLRLPDALDRKLRLIIVTPNMHIAHHSAWQPETDTNYGSLFSFWDRLFGTYTERPRGGYDAMQIGLEEIPPKQASSFWWQIASPLFRLKRVKDLKADKP